MYIIGNDIARTTFWISEIMDYGFPKIFLDLDFFNAYDELIEAHINQGDDMEAKAAATPYTMHRLSSSSNIYAVVNVDNEQIRIETNNKATAKFIETACNNHDEMVKVLGWAIGALQLYEDVGPFTPEFKKAKLFLEQIKSSSKHRIEAA